MGLRLLAQFNFGCALVGGGAKIACFVGECDVVDGGIEDFHEGRKRDSREDDPGVYARTPVLMIFVQQESLWAEFWFR